MLRSAASKVIRARRTTIILLSVLAVGFGVSATAMAAAPPWFPINQSRNATTDIYTVTFNDNLPSGTESCFIRIVGGASQQSNAVTGTTNSCSFNMSELDTKDFSKVVYVEFFEMDGAIPTTLLGPGICRIPDTVVRESIF